MPSPKRTRRFRRWERKDAGFAHGWMGWHLRGAPTWPTASRRSTPRRRRSSGTWSPSRSGQRTSTRHRSGSASAILSAAKRRATVTSTRCVAAAICSPRLRRSPGRWIYVNEGRLVHALERFTGRAVWPPFVERQAPSGNEQGSRQIADLNIVAVREGTIVTITGHAYADAARSDRTVVCLDVATGKLRWASRLDRLSRSDELDGLFPHGAPVIGEGMVYVLARKVSRQLLTSCYVIALNLQDGRLSWTRHVASSGGIRSRFSRPFSTPVLHDGDLVVATAVGAVGRFDAGTGQTRLAATLQPAAEPVPGRSPPMGDQQPGDHAPRRAGAAARPP